MGLVPEYMDNLVPISFREKIDGVSEISDSEILETLNGLLREASNTKDANFVLTGREVQSVLSKTSITRINKIFKSGGWAVKQYDCNTLIFSEWNKFPKPSKRCLVLLGYLIFCGITYYLFFMLWRPTNNGACAFLFITNFLISVIFAAAGPFIRND